MSLKKRIQLSLDSDDIRAAACIFVVNFLSSYEWNFNGSLNLL